MDTQSGKLTEVQILQRGNDLVLVQWLDADEILQRAWVDKSYLRDQTGRSAKMANPASGVPYGVEFHRILKLKATAKDIERELKNRGIWTSDDVRTRPQEVIGALIAVFGVDLASLIQAVSRYEQELKTEA